VFSRDRAALWRESEIDFRIGSPGKRETLSRIVVNSGRRSRLEVSALRRVLGENSARWSEADTAFPPKQVSLNPESARKLPHPLNKAGDYFRPDPAIWDGRLQ